jgi:Protein of unknown function (DUF1236)
VLDDVIQFGPLALQWLTIVNAERKAAVYVARRSAGGEQRSSPMTIKWLGTTIALLIGTGAVIAQPQQELQQKREEGTRAQTPSLPSKEADRPAASEGRPADRMNERAAQPEPKTGAKEPQRGEAASTPERRQAQEPSELRDTKQPAKQSDEQRRRSEREQAQEPSQPGDTKQPTKQSQEQPGRGERPPANTTRQSQEEQKGREAKQPAEQMQRQGREEQPKQDNRAVDTRRPAETRQQQGQQEPERDRNEQAGRPSATPPTQQGARPSDMSQDRQRSEDRQRGQNTGRAEDESARQGRASVMVNDDQRRQIIERLQRERMASNQNINVRVNVGERLPEHVQPRPLPPDIVRIAPQYRDYEYTVVEDRIAIVDPRTREVVDVVDDQPGSAVGRTARVERDRDRVVLTREQRETLKQAARRTTTTVGSTSSSGPDSSCLRLEPVPEDMARNNPELSSYRYLAIGDEVVLVDPRQQKVVQVID